MRELQLLDETAEALGAVFTDVDALAQHCRFRDCAHGAAAFANLPETPVSLGALRAAEPGSLPAEPGCAVWAAVEAGTLPLDRLAAYHKLRQETAHTARRDDKSGETRYKKGVKRVQTAMHRHKRRRDG
jgi:ribosome biogenesis GTPase